MSSYSEQHNLNINEGYVFSGKPHDGANQQCAMINCGLKKNKKSENVLDRKEII
jgi:hypothetical protein